MADDFQMLVYKKGIGSCLRNIPIWIIFPSYFETLTEDLLTGSRNESLSCHCSSFRQLVPLDRRHPLTPSSFESDSGVEHWHTKKTTGQECKREESLQLLDQLSSRVIQQVLLPPMREGELRKLGFQFYPHPCSADIQAIIHSVNAPHDP